MPRAIRVALLGGLACLALSCGFESESSFRRAEGDDDGLAVLSTSPSSEETGVDLASSITVTFSRSIDPLTISSTSILVENGSSQVPGTIAVSGSALVFEPDANLLYFSAHEVTVSGVSSVGSGPASPHTWTFQTRDLRWGDPLVLSTSMAETPNPVVDVDEFGNGLAAWQAIGSVRSDTVASAYTPATGWTSPRIIDSLDSNVSSPRVLVDESGAGYVVWKQDAAAVSDLWAIARADTGTWSAPQLVEIVSGNVHGFAIAAAPGAGARIAWSQDNGTSNEIFSRTISPGGSLGLLESIAASGSNFDSDGVALAIAQDGSSICSFSSYDGTRRNLFASRFAPGSGWASAQSLESVTQHAEVLDVVFGQNGAALTLWQLNSSPNPQRTLWSNRFTTSNGWGAPERVDADQFGVAASGGRLAFLPDGDAVAIWTQGTGGIRDLVWNRRVPGVLGWQTPQLLTTSNGIVGGATLAIDGRGNGVAFFAQNIGGSTKFYTARWLDEAWTVSAEFSSEVGDGTIDAALSSNGDGVAVWSMNTNGGYVLSREFR